MGKKQKRCFYQYYVLARTVCFLPRDASAERGNATVSRLSVRPSVCLSVRNVQVPCSYTLEFFENNFTAE